MVEYKFLGIQKSPENVFERFGLRFRSNQGGKYVRPFRIPWFAGITAGVKLVYDGIVTFPLLEQVSHDLTLLDAGVRDFAVKKVKSLGKAGFHNHFARTNRFTGCPSKGGEKVIADAPVCNLNGFCSQRESLELVFRLGYLRDCIEQNFGP